MYSVGELSTPSAMVIGDWEETLTGNMIIIVGVMVLGNMFITYLSWNQIAASFPGSFPLSEHNRRIEMSLGMRQVRLWA